MHCDKHDSCHIVFRRFRRDKNGNVLDAHAYGHRAWPIHVKT